MGDYADPSLITIPPIEQYAADYTFATPEYSKGQYQNYFMFVVDSRQTGGIILDGKPLPQNQTYVHIPDTNLAAGYVHISVGTHSVTHSNPNTVIGGIIFGKAAIESYGFPIGLLTQPVNSVSIYQVLQRLITIAFLCQKVRLDRMWNLHHS